MVFVENQIITVYELNNTNNKAIYSGALPSDPSWYILLQHMLLFSSSNYKHPFYLLFTLCVRLFECDRKPALFETLPHLSVSIHGKKALL